MIIANPNRLLYFKEFQNQDNNRAALQAINEINSALSIYEDTTHAEFVIRNVKYYMSKLCILLDIEHVSYNAFYELNEQFEDNDEIVGCNCGFLSFEFDNNTITTEIYLKG